MVDKTEALVAPNHTLGTISATTLDMEKTMQLTGLPQHRNKATNSRVYRSQKARLDKPCYAPVLGRF